MKAHCVIWADFPKSIDLPKWFKPGETIDIVPEQIIELFKCGVNCQLRHARDNETDVILFIDHKGFTQR